MNDGYELTRQRLTLDLSEVTSGSEIFYLCKSFTWDDVKFIMSKFSSKLTSLSWRCFRDCVKLVGPIPENLFDTCTNLTDINEMFTNCTGITGEIPENLFANNKKLSVVKNAFNGTKITGEIPENLFKSAGSSLTNVESAFANTNVDTMPSGNLFKYNTNLSNCRALFQNCKQLIGEVPETLLHNKNNLTDCSSMFNGCSGVFGEIPVNFLKHTSSGSTSKLKYIYHLFYGTNMTGTIPDNIFDNLVALEQVHYFFPRNISGQISPDLFKYNTKLTNVSGLFDGCKNITGVIPSTLFKNTPNLSLANYLFKNCTGLDTEIPKGLFDNCTLLTEVAEMFCGCKGIKGQIPKRISYWEEREVDGDDGPVMEQYEVVEEYGLFDNAKGLVKANGLFRYCNNLKSTIPETLFIGGENIQDLSYIFEDCWELYGQIPEDLFKNCKKLINLTGAFMDCVKLGKSSLEVSEDDKYAIPENLFKNCRELKTISNIFSMWGQNPYSNTLRGEIPRYLFRYNTKLEDCNSAFAGCNLITGELDGDLFVNCTKLKNCSQTFWGPQFTSVGSKMLKNNPEIQNISYMFKGNGKVSGPAPKLWETPATITTQCFNGCSFDDQNDIPPTYK